MNSSLFTALDKEPNLRVALIKTSTSVLRERLQRRGRETDAEIERRLKRAAHFNRIEHPNVTIVNNDGTLEQAGDAFIRLLSRNRQVGSTI